MTIKSVAKTNWSAQSLTNNVAIEIVPHLKNVMWCCAGDQYL